MIFTHKKDLLQSVYGGSQQNNRIVTQVCL